METEICDYRGDEYIPPFALRHGSFSPYFSAPFLLIHGTGNIDSSSSEDLQETYVSVCRAHFTNEISTLFKCDAEKPCHGFKFAVITGSEFQPAF